MEMMETRPKRTQHKNVELAASVCVCNCIQFVLCGGHLTATRTKGAVRKQSNHRPNPFSSGAITRLAAYVCACGS